MDPAQLGPVQGGSLHPTVAGQVDVREIEGDVAHSGHDALLTLPPESGLRWVGWVEPAGPELASVGEQLDGHHCNCFWSGGNRQGSTCEKQQEGDRRHHHRRVFRSWVRGAGSPIAVKCLPSEQAFD